ncbi:MAG: tRNA glutamyl-Q(34) synthetase GluQRS [Rhodobacteraceae bacterium]|nr:MAG: tRNA glutamyl-Q(34) synthetase GluQRS [Paracoccaceae bacterium]
MPLEARATRFAPSPTGPLHLGHAYAALIAQERAGAGRVLLRIEDIDQSRCRPEFETQIYDDLRWLGFDWVGPVMRQSDRLPAYRAALAGLAAVGVIYPCRCTRADIRASLSAPQEGAPLGPDGVTYPGTCRARSMSEASPQDAIRLNMSAALARVGRLSFVEHGPEHPGRHVIDNDWLRDVAGDVVLARRDMGTSYHLSVVVDDAAQAITEVTRGSDLFDATSVHVLLQALLQLPQPSYYHHALIRDDDGKRLAKRDDARALALCRAHGQTPDDIRLSLGLAPDA